MPNETVTQADPRKAHQKPPFEEPRQAPPGHESGQVAALRSLNMRFASLERVLGVRILAAFAVACALAAPAGAATYANGVDVSHYQGQPRRPQSNLSKWWEPA